MNRSWRYKGLEFHLNDNYDIHNKPPRAEFEGRYKLMMWDDGYERWKTITTVQTKKEAQQLIVKNYGNLWRYGVL